MPYEKAALGLRSTRTFPRCDQVNSWSVQPGAEHALKFLL
jgi:hypothetical protein